MVVVVVVMVVGVAVVVVAVVAAFSCVCVCVFSVCVCVFFLCWLCWLGFFGCVCVCVCLCLLGFFGVWAGLLRVRRLWVLGFRRFFSGVLGFRRFFRVPALSGSVAVFVGVFPLPFLQESERGKPEENATFQAHVWFFPLGFRPMSGFSSGGLSVSGLSGWLGYWATVVKLGGDNLLAS